MTFRKKKPAREAEAKLLSLFSEWGWKAFKFQKDAWAAYQKGESGLVHAPTGTGKTYAVWAPPLLEWMAETAHQENARTPGLRVLWITPLRALVEDTTLSLGK